MKISIVGSGHVGATAAFFVAAKGLADVVLLDVVDGLPQGKSLDMMQAAPLQKFEKSITGSNNYEDTAGSELVVITAGLARKPGMDRLNLLKKNAGIVQSVVEQVVKHSPETKIVMVTNPMDVMTCLALKVSKFPRERVLGMGGVLDSARCRYFLAKETRVKFEDTSALVIGMHSEQMLPLPAHCTVSGKPITGIMSQDKINNLIERTRKGGAEIVSYLKTGSAYIAPAASIAEFVEIVIKDKKDVILPVSVHLQGEYGIDGVCLGVPVRLGKDGLAEIVQLKLTDEQQVTLKKSAENIKEALKNINL